MQDNKTSVLTDNQSVTSMSSTLFHDSRRESSQDAFSLFHEIDDAILTLTGTISGESSTGRMEEIDESAMKSTITTDDFSGSSICIADPFSGQKRHHKKLKKKREFAEFQPQPEGMPEPENRNENQNLEETGLPPKREKVRRRRQIDPTTCERDYSLDEIEFMNALDGYKRTSGRMFPTCSEILEVIRSLGYVKMPQDQNANQDTAFAAMTATPLHAGTPALLDETCGESEEIVTVLWSGKEKETEETPLMPSEEFPDFDYREPLLIF